MGASTGKLMVGRGAAMLIGFAAAPVLTRVYDPADFGLAEIVSSVCVWAGSFACLSYAAALPLSKDSSETRSLIRLCLLLTLGLSALLVLGVAATADMTARLTGKPVLRGLQWFVPAVFLLLSLLQIGQHTCSREGRFGVLSVSYFMQGSIRPLLQIGLGWWMAATAGSLLWGAVAGHVCGVVVASIAVLPVLASRAPAGSEASSVADVARRHAQFAKAGCGARRSIRRRDGDAASEQEARASPIGLVQYRAPVRPVVGRSGPRPVSAQRERHAPVLALPLRRPCRPSWAGAAMIQLGRRGLFSFSLRGRVPLPQAT